MWQIVGVIAVFFVGAAFGMALMAALVMSKQCDHWDGE